MPEITPISIDSALGFLISHQNPSTGTPIPDIEPVFEGSPGGYFYLNVANENRERLALYTQETAKGNIAIFENQDNILRFAVLDQNQGTLMSAQNELERRCVIIHSADNAVAEHSLHVQVFSTAAEYLHLAPEGSPVQVLTMHDSSSGLALAPDITSLDLTGRVFQISWSDRDR
jgi:hypothetical protein